MFILTVINPNDWNGTAWQCVTIGGRTIDIRYRYGSKSSVVFHDMDSGMSRGDIRI